MLYELFNEDIDNDEDRDVGYEPGNKELAEDEHQLHFEFSSGKTDNGPYWRPALWTGMVMREFEEEDVDKLRASLVGKNVVRVHISADQHQLTFVNEPTSLVRWITQADCCSRSWIESIDFPIKGIVSDVSKLSMSIDCKEGADWEEPVVRCYGICIVTNEGTSIIEFRNASNGHYGGWMVVDEIIE